MTSADLLLTERMVKPEPVKLRALDIASRYTVQKILTGRQTVLIKPVEPQPRERDGKILLTWKHKKLDVAGVEVFKACPFGQPGDRFYVREPWTPAPSPSGVEGAVDRSRVLLAADYGNWDPFQRTRWRATVHMPKDVARLFLRTQVVGIAPLHTVSREDLHDTGLRLGMTHWEGQIQEVFQYEWDLLYKRASRGWDTNPWVWTMRFERVEAE